jgi:hypothetical protein
MNKFVKKVITGFTGDISSKRIAGLILISAALGIKLCLAWYGAKVRLVEHFTIFDKIDNSTNILLYVGAALLGGGLVEFLGRK